MENIMSDIHELHSDAMDMAEQAIFARRKGKTDEALALFEEAYRLEIQVAHRSLTEPSRSVMYRSAASLALNAKLYREAEKACAAGLAGDAPLEIADELRSVFEEAMFYNYHLPLRGIELLDESEFQMSIVGNAIASGLAEANLVIPRLQHMQSIVISTVQRLYKKTLEKTASTKLYALYMSPPRAGSYAVTLRLGAPEQSMLPLLDDRASVIEEIMRNLDLVNNQAVEELQNAIQDPEYYQHFVALVKQIAPDGDDIQRIGWTKVHNGRQSSVELSRTKSEIKPFIMEGRLGRKATESEDEKLIQITGQVLFANAEGKKILKIKITDDNGQRHTVTAPKSIVDDIVRPYFGTRVTIDALQKGDKNKFVDISPLE